MSFNFLKYFTTVILFFTSVYGAQNFVPEYSIGRSEKEVPDTLSVLAVMVDFKEDDLDQTTGTGKFNSGYPDTLRMDSVTHDRQYFTDQLEFVKNYFESQSDQNSSVRNITFDTLYVAEDIITAPYPMWYYNPNNGGDVLAERLGELYNYSWSQIKDDEQIGFKDFNTFVIYHAGSGAEFGLGQTFFDLPSVYLSSKDLEETFTPKVITHDSLTIPHSIILPECQWQIYEGGWYYAGMGGISCLMFAHRLGIPNLYSSEDGSSGIGKFGLMDQGSANFSGMLPSGVSAWVKELKGWADVKMITGPQQDIEIEAGTDIYRIDINRDEYFLIENRTPVNFTSASDSLYGYDRDGREIRFYYDEDGNEKYEADDGFKTLVSIQDDDYDFGLPAGFGIDEIDGGSLLPESKGGILIWHIDKNKTTDDHIENNSVNNDPDNRGVYLEEGDGSFDIGNDYWLLDNGYGTELGWYYDAFFKGNKVWLDYSNTALTGVQFSSVSYPRSDTNDGIQTGIKLNEFSRIGREMRFSFSYEEDNVYFSVDPGLGTSVYLPAYADDGAIRHYFAGADGKYKVYFKNDAQKDSLLYEGSYPDSLNTDFIPVQFGGKIITVTQDKQKIYLTDIVTGTFSDLTAPGTILSQPVDGVFALDTGIYEIDTALTGTELVSDEFLDADKLKVLRNDSGELIFLAGTEAGSTIFSVGPADAPETVSRTVISADSLYYYSILTDADRADYSLFMHSVPKESSRNVLMFCDIDTDGRPEIVTASEGSIGVKSEQDIYENGFPVGTALGCIEKGFIFVDDEKFIVAADTSSNYALISGSGDYDLSSERTINSFSKNSGLLKIDTGVYLYSHSGSGILSYHKIGTGGVEHYLESLTGTVTLSDGSSFGGSDIVSKNVYNWPNPARGNETNFRFFLNEPCKVDIDIYDINGNRIGTLSRDFSISGDYAELVWDVSNVASGVYNAVLSFSSDSRKEKRLVRTAVIK